MSAEQKRIKLGDTSANCRPRYSKLIFEAVCDLHASGRTLNQPCEECGITPITLYRWLKSGPGLEELLGFAKESFRGVLADRVVSVSSQENPTEIATIRKTQHSDGWEEKTQTLTRRDNTARSKLHVSALESQIRHHQPSPGNSKLGPNDPSRWSNRQLAAREVTVHVINDPDLIDGSERQDWSRDD